MEDGPALDKKYKSDIEGVGDRLVVREGIETRLADSLETALKLSEGLVYMDPADPSPSRSREGLGEGLSPNGAAPDTPSPRSEEHTSELQSLMRISYAVFCLKKTKQ